MLSDKQYPTFVLRGTDHSEGSGREVWSWGDQMNQLFVYKMSEALRVLLGLKLLFTGPDVEQGSTDIYNKVNSSPPSLPTSPPSLTHSLSASLPPSLSCIHFIYNSIFPSVVCTAKLSISTPGVSSSHLLPSTSTDKYPLRSRTSNAQTTSSS